MGANSRKTPTADDAGLGRTVLLRAGDRSDKWIVSEGQERNPRRAFFGNG